MPLDRNLLKQESERKLFHVAWAIVPMLYYFGYPRDGMVLLTFCLLIIWCGFEATQRRGFRWLSEAQMREHEQAGMLTGTFYQVLSLFLAVLLFDKPTAVLAMLFCCMGDSITGLAGALMYDVLGARKTLIREYGRVMLPLRPASVIADVRHAIRHRKSPLLMAVMFISCAATGLIMYPALALAFISAGAIGAVAADAFAWRFFGLTLNDDLTITLAAGGAMTLLAIL